MIFLSKLFAIFALPPGCIIAALILIIIFIPRRYKLALSLVTALLYLLSIQPVSDALLRPLEDTHPPLPALESITEDKVEAIVILGGGIIQGSPEAGAGKGTLAAGAMKRAVYAYNMRDNFSAPYIFSGGIVFDRGQEAEAVTAGRLFTSLGLPEERLVLESNSRNTWENAEETAKLGYREIILVTSAYHMRRSVFCFERNGMIVIPAPTDYISERGRNYDFLSFMPSMSNLQSSSLALHEYIGLLSYRIIYQKK